ncbi:hypothetical protein EAG_12427 [Camponotus floridanus]|uniref:Uncharacterized protein n=1 Tax=Camponotus floridanus TaxID=104421 RepID=E2AWG4_CAMFO|nr:hypothetical protein EAG_12427 [Camponotus floridanus]
MKALLHFMYKGEVNSVGIEVRVTNEIPVVSTETNVVQDAAPPWTTTSVPSRTSPPTPTNPHPHYLSPYVLHGRNSLCSANAFDYFRLHAKKTTHDIAHRPSPESSEQKHIRTNHNH